MNIYQYQWRDGDQGDWHQGGPVLATNPCRAIRKAANELDNNGIVAWEIVVTLQSEDFL